MTKLTPNHVFEYIIDSNKSMQPACDMTHEVVNDITHNFNVVCNEMS